MQGTAADLIKLAMIAVQEWLDREKLAVEAHHAGARRAGARGAAKPSSTRVRAEVPRLMSGVAQLKVPLVVDVGSGRELGKSALSLRQEGVPAALA